MGNSVVKDNNASRLVFDAGVKYHTGFKSFIWFMRRFKPRYLVHGHVHLYSLNDKRISQYQQTTVVNAYDHIVIELPQQN